MPEADALREMQAATQALVTDKNLETLIGQSVHAAAPVLANHPPGLQDARFLKALGKTITNNQSEELLETLKVLERRALAGNREAHVLLRKTSTEFQKGLQTKQLSEWLGTSDPTTILKLLKISNAHCAPGEVPIGLADPRLGPAVKALLDHPGTLYAMPEFVANLVQQNRAVRQMSLGEFSSAKLDPNTLVTILNGLSKILPGAEGWEAARTFLQAADPRGLQILRHHMAKSRAKYSHGQWEELAEAERHPAGSRPLPSGPTEIRALPAPRRNAHGATPMGCVDFMRQVQAIEKALK